MLFLLALLPIVAGSAILPRARNPPQVKLQLDGTDDQCLTRISCDGQSCSPPGKGGYSVGLGDCSEGDIWTFDKDAPLGSIGNLESGEFLRAFNVSGYHGEVELNEGEYDPSIGEGWSYNKHSNQIMYERPPSDINVNVYEQALLCLGWNSGTIKLDNCDPGDILMMQAWKVRDV